ncbi:MAG: VTT domain-containing protein [Mariprofundaceae bacterium]
MEMEWAREVVAQYGLLAVFVSTLLEGEAMVLIAAALAGGGLLSVPGVVLAAAGGAFAGHLVFFAVGRRWGMRLIRALPSLHRHYPRANFVMDRHAAWSVFIFQYLYGMRLISAILFGCSTLSWARFVLLQTINCLSWALLVFATGSGLGWLGVRLYDAAGLTGVLAGLGLLAIVCTWLWRRFGRRMLTAIWRDWREPGPEASDVSAGRAALRAWLAESGQAGRGLVLLELPRGERREALAAMILREIRYVDRAFRLAGHLLAIAPRDGADLDGLERRMRALPGLAAVRRIRLDEPADREVLRGIERDAPCDAGAARLGYMRTKRSGAGTEEDCIVRSTQAGGMEVAGLPEP